MPKPLVAIVGRPNVGKSTLFNRISGEFKAIVSEIAGTTRDRVTTDTVWGGREFILVDTGGLALLSETDLEEKVRQQIGIAVDQADVIVMVVDASQGVTPGDRDVAEALRPAGKSVVLAANKADNVSRETGALEFYELGLDDPIPVSAYHNLGIDDLMAQVIARLPGESDSPEPDADLRLAIVGRTNVGKSQLLNAITGEERSIVSPIPGTTRDAVDTLVRFREQTVLLIDTAGIRRRGKIQAGIERYSALRAVRAIDRADVVILVVDASELATNQDAHVASYVLESYKGLVIAVNKWDLAHGLELTRDDAVMHVQGRFKFASYAPICLISALRETGIESLLDTAWDVYGEWTKSVPRYDLRRLVLNAVAEHPPAAYGKRSAKIYSVSQDQTGPPSFTFYVNRPEMVHFSYQRYLENTLRAAYGFKGSRLRFRFKARGEA